MAETHHHRLGHPGRQRRALAEREHLASNIVAHASQGVSYDVHRVIAYWTSVDAALGARVAAGLGHRNAGSRSSRPTGV